VAATESLYGSFISPYSGPNWTPGQWLAGVFAPAGPPGRSTAPACPVLSTLRARAPVMQVRFRALSVPGTGCLRALPNDLGSVLGPVRLAPAARRAVPCRPAARLGSSPRPGSGCNATRLLGAVYPGQIVICAGRHGGRFTSADVGYAVVYRNVIELTKFLLAATPPVPRCSYRGELLLLPIATVRQPVEAALIQLIALACLFLT
jgi:hypothetical protein